MAEYIERAELMKFPIRIDHYDKEHGNVNFVYGVETVLEYAKNIPTADVVPVVHSEWKYFRKQGKAVCMNCSFERSVDDNFGRAIACPNCGARMDGDGNG